MRSAYTKAQTGFGKLPDLVRFTFFFLIALGVAGYISVFIVETQTDTAWDWWERWLVFGSIGTVGVLVVAGYGAFLQLRETQRARHSEVLLRLNEIWASDRMTESRHKMWQAMHGGQSLEDKQTLLRNAIKAADKADERGYFMLIAIGDFFDLVAHMLKWRYLRDEETYEEFGPPLVHYYDYFKKFVDEERGTPRSQGLWNGWEGLAEKFGPRVQSPDTKQLARTSSNVMQCSYPRKRVFYFLLAAIALASVVTIFYTTAKGIVKFVVRAHIPTGENQTSQNR